MYFCELNQEEFRLFAEGHPLKSFVQTPEMGTFKKNHGWDLYYVGLKEGDTILCATMMVANGNFLGRKMFYVPYGFLIDFENVKMVETFTKKIKQFIKKKKGYTLVIDPYYPLIERDIDGKVVPGGFDHTGLISSMKRLGYHYLGTTDQVKYMFVLDVVGKEENELLKAMNSNVKRSIQKSLKEGIVFREIDKEELPKFKEIMAATGERNHFLDRSLEYYQEMYDLLKPSNLVKYVVGEIHFPEYIGGIEKEISEEKAKLDSLKETKKRATLLKIEQLTKKMNDAILIQKEHGDVVITSAAMFILYGDEVIYLFGGNLKEFMHFHTAHRVQWEMIQYALKNGYQKYNFYGISTTNPNDPEYGVYLFKRGFNGYVVELIGEFELPIHYTYYLRKGIKKVLKH